MMIQSLSSLQPANSIFLSQQISTNHQAQPAEQSECCLLARWLMQSIQNLQATVGILILIIK